MAPSPRFSILVDPEEYYAAVASACEKAVDTIAIVGWAIDSRARLHPGAPAGELPDELGPFLAALVARRRSLRVRVLAWDVAMVFGLESGFFPVFRTGADSHRRFEWELDSEHALGAATHQKVIVVDDRVAFVGGMDLTGERWDTREHAPGDPRRVHAGRPYRPYHDAGVVLDGEPAAALGQYLRARWSRATGRSVPFARFRAGIRALEPGRPLGHVLDRAAQISHRAHDRAQREWRALRGGEPPEAGHDRWPDGVAAQARDVNVALARTEAAYLWHPSVREIEVLWIESIAAARSCIYIENQYFTSRTIAEAVAARLAEPSGPEVVIVQPLQCAGWLEQATMGVLRDAHLRTLKAADQGGRLRVYYPVNAGGEAIYLHSKVLVVDDAVIRIGSANVSNRSMALDMELDVHVESAGRDELAAMARDLRDGLVAEHLDRDVREVREATRREGSLGKAIDALRGEGRRLVDLPFDSPTWLQSIVPSGLADPEHPADPWTVSQQVAAGPAGPSRWQEAKAVVVGLLVIALAACWTLVPVGRGEGAATLADLLEPWANSPIAPVLAVVLFVIAGMVAFPMTVMVVSTELAFGPWLGSLVSLAGGMASSCVGYLQGRLIGRRWLRRLGGSALNRVSRALASHGVLTVAAARLMPLIPWTLTNLVAGASHVRPLDYLLGTFVGLVPAIVAAALLTDAAGAPGPYAVIELVVFALLLGGIFAWGRAHLRRTAGA